MQLCKSFFPTEKGKKLWRSLTPFSHNHLKFNKHEYKIIIGGRVSQCLLDRIIIGWCDHFGPTSEDGDYGGFVDNDGGGTHLDLWRMADDGLWSPTPMALQWLRTTDAIVIVFCVNQRESFDKLVDECDYLLQLKEKNDIPLILVGSEPGYCDRFGNTRQVTAEEAENLGQKLGGGYFEISAVDAAKKRKGPDHGDALYRYIAMEIQRKLLSENIS